MALSGLVLLGSPHARELLGQWRQVELAAHQDLRIPTYRNALAAAYAQGDQHDRDAIGEGPVVRFSTGARPDDQATPQPGRGTSPLDGARIRIPAIALDQALVEGVSAESLRTGPGHYPGTALPGEVGNAVISGHRTTYTRPFADLDQLGSGDLVYLDTARWTFAYRVIRVRVVDLDQRGPLRSVRFPKLTLTTCHPPGAATQRLVVEGRLTM